MSSPPLSGSGPSRTSVAASVKWGRGWGSRSPSGSGPRRSSRCPACWARSVLGLRRPDRPGPEAAGRLRTRGRGDGHEADPAKPDEQRGSSNLPWSPRPPGRPARSGPASGTSPGAQARPLGTPPAQAGAAGAGLRWRWRRAARCRVRPREGARAAVRLPAPSVSSVAQAPAPSWAALAAPALSPVPPVPPLPRLGGSAVTCVSPRSPGPRTSVPCARA